MQASFVTPIQTLLTPGPLTRALLAKLRHGADVDEDWTQQKCSCVLWVQNLLERDALGALSGSSLEAAPQYTGSAHKQKESTPQE
jgi:hypothetical protein